jgi:hypothetical protein
MLHRQVHRFQLIRDQSAFEDMFSCPAVASEELEGECDDNPIQLQGDSVEEVRALIGYLYSSYVFLLSVDDLYLYYFVCRPHETQKIWIDDADCHRCCCLARIAHKYHFDSITNWALDAIKIFWMRRDFCSWAASSQLMEITNIASLCQDANLVRIVTDSWTRIVQVGLVSKITLAIKIAEQHDLPIVKGRAYYAIMIRGRKVWERDGVLTVPQRLRLLSGFHALAQLCNVLETQEAPEITHTACASITLTLSSSPTVARCKSAWSCLWKMVLTHPKTRGVFVSLSPADYIGRLSCISTNLKLFHGKMLVGTSWKMAPGCLKSALAEVKAMSEECTRRLPDMFVDPK